MNCAEQLTLPAQGRRLAKLSSSESIMNPFYWPPAPGTSDTNGMVHVRALWCSVLVFLASLGLPASRTLAQALQAQDPVPPPALRQLSQPAPNPSLPAPKPAASDQPLPINLPTALQLAGAA